jgi:hypothetical protein
MRSHSPSLSDCELSDIERLPELPALNDSVRSALVLPPPGHWARGSLEDAEESSDSEGDRPPHPVSRRNRRPRSRFRSFVGRHVRRRLSFPSKVGMAHDVGGNHDGTIPVSSL